MVRVRRTTVLDAPIDAVWRILRDFNGHDRWHPIVERSGLEDARRTDQVGAVRNFTIRSGEHVREVLLTLSDRERRLRYAIVGSDLPLRDYVAELFLKPVTDGNRTFWSWSSRFGRLPEKRRPWPGSSARRSTRRDSRACGPRSDFAPARPRLRRRRRGPRSGG